MRSSPRACAGSARPTAAPSPPPLLRRSQLVVDDRLERRRRLRALDLTPVDHEARRTGDAERARLGDVGLDLGQGLLVVEAVVELRLVDLLVRDEADRLLLHVGRVDVLL